MTFDEMIERMNRATDDHMGLDEPRLTEVKASLAEQARIIHERYNRAEIAKAGVQHGEFRWSMPTADPRRSFGFPVRKLSR